MAMSETPPMPAEAPTRTRSSRAWAVMVAGGIAAGTLAWMMVGRKHHDPHADPPRDVPSVEGAYIRFSPEFAQRSKVSFAAAETASLKPTITVTGTVTFDPEHVAAVG